MVPIEDWTAVAKKDFDVFSCSEACMDATKKNDATSSAAPAPTPKAKRSLL